MSNTTQTKKPVFYIFALSRRAILMASLDESIRATTDQIAQQNNFERQIEEIKGRIKEAVTAKDKVAAQELRDLRDEWKEHLRGIKQEVQGLKHVSMLTVEQIVKIDEFLEVTDGIDDEYKGDTLGTAVKSGSYVEDSPEWHAARANGIGGSDISIIMGVSPFKKRDALLKMKTGEVVQQVSNVPGGAAHRGHVWEGFIAREFADKNPDKKVLYTKDSWQNKDDENKKANFDGLICENGSDVPNAILEIKTTSKPEDWANGVPEHYRLQVIWYMSNCGFSKGYVAVRINDAEYRQYEVTTTDEEIANIHAEVATFLEEVAARKAELAQEAVAA